MIVQEMVLLEVRVEEEEVQKHYLEQVVRLLRLGKVVLEVQVQDKMVLTIELEEEEVQVPLEVSHLGI